mmetsp:Transcript_29246/g.64915  ORF Transcript_29246/g.64915 Transcript_29246/m.64915 type:complete len:196 (+) Transcript_29246:85-672(+)
MSYLDIDTILSEEERIPATFIVEAPGLGHLDNSIDSEDLPEQSRIEMPLWLAMAFAKRGMVTLELPKHFEKKMREEILAGAQNIDLREFSFYFFEVGSTLAVEMKNEDLRQSLQIAFAGERFRSLMTNSLSSWNDDLTEFAQNLTAAEAHILKEGLASSKDLHEWRIMRSSLLKRSSILGRRALDSGGQPASKKH